MRVQMKVRTRRKQSFQKWEKRGKSLHHRGERRSKQFKEPWMKRMRDLERLSPGKIQAERKKTSINGTEVQF